MRNSTTLLAFSIALFFLTRWIVHTARAADDTAKESPALARFSSWVLFGGRAVEGAPFLVGADLAGVRGLRTSGQAIEVTSTYEALP